MIDLIQWRVTIGTWHCSSNNSKGSKREYDHGEVSHLVDEWWIGSLRLLQAILTVAVILSYSLVMILLLLCGDVEINPGPVNIELTANEALNILQQSGFNIPEKWNRLAGIIGISIGERRRLTEEAQTTQDYHFALEQALDSWILNAPQSSWEGLLTAVEQCETDRNVVSTLRKLLDVDDRQKLLQRIIQIPIIEWKRVGILLGIEDFHIQRIDNDERGISNKCTFSMFQHWVDNDTSFSTYEEGLLKLADVLEKVEQKRESSQLKRECGIPERKRCAKYEIPVTNPFILNTEDDYPPSKKVHHDVVISESTTKRKRCDKEGEYSGANPYVSFISESEDESHSKTSKDDISVSSHGISVSSHDISVSSMEECEENDSEGLQILSTTLDMVGQNALANQLKQECASTSGRAQSIDDSCPQISCEPNQLTPFNILKRHFSEILDVVSDPDRLANDLWGVDLISNVVKDNIISTPSVPRYEKTSKLLNDVQRSLKVNENPETIISLCEVLTNQNNSVISMICKTMMKELGLSSTLLPTDELITESDIFSKELQDYYKHELSDVDEHKFGQLGLIKGHGGCLSKQEGMQRTWNMLHGKLDNIMNVSKKIDIQDVLKHNDDNSPIKVVVDGPPGVGKTTLCHKLCNMWAKNELKKCSFDHVFLLPLRDERVSSAENICDLVSLFHSSKKLCETVSEQIMEKNGRGLLLILDGWDEFGKRESTERSFILDTIHRKVLQSCSIMITSRTYASSSLLKITNVRHIEVLGFEKEEIVSFIEKKLPHDKAEQLIKDLEVRGDVLTLCYIPFVCSMLLTVYYQCDYILPNTLTELYKEFVLYYMKRSMEKKGLDPEMIESFSDLTKPKHNEQKKAFDELCFCAYSNLKTQSNTFTRDQIEELTYSSVFKHFELMQFYKIAGIITYQFRHLTIQEFLAAWWISQQDDQEKLFQEHFEDTHFCMTLRFVAGLTELKDDSYQEYFNKEVDLQCIRKPLFGFESHQCSMLHQNPQLLCDDILYAEYPLHEPYYDTDTIQLLHLIYESENKVLCQIFVSSIINSSLCVDRVNSSQFDLLCLSFLLKNSKITWNYLHHDKYVHNKLKLSNEDSNMTNCIVMKGRYTDVTSIIKIHQSSLCQYLQESYIDVSRMYGTIHYDSFVIMLTHLFKLPHLTILHVHIKKFLSTQSEEHIDNELLVEMEKVLSTNHTIQEFLIELSKLEFNSLINSLITGLERNDTIQLFSLSSDSTYTKSLQIQELLKNNQTLKAIKLNIPSTGILPSPCIVNESLTALNISNDTVHDIITYPVKKTETLSPGLENFGRNITNLKSLSLYKPLMPFIIYLDSNPFLQHLDIVLEREESLNELFNILSSNRTVIALGMVCEYIGLFHDEVGKSLQLMLSSNKSLQCLEIESRAFDCTLLIKYLTTGLRRNNTLQELNVGIEFSENINFKEFFETTDNLKSLRMKFHTVRISEWVSTSFYLEEIIPHVTNMLKRNEDMKFLKVKFLYSASSKDTYKEDWIPIIHEFWETVLLHPSLCYVMIPESSIMIDILNDMKKTLITQRKEKKLGPHPIVEIAGGLRRFEKWN